MAAFVCRLLSGDAEPDAVVAALDRDDLSLLAHDAGEHRDSAFNAPAPAAGTTTAANCGVRH